MGVSPFWYFNAANTANFHMYMSTLSIEVLEYLQVAHIFVCKNYCLEYKCRNIYIKKLKWLLKHLKYGWFLILVWGVEHTVFSDCTPFNVIIKYLLYSLWYTIYPCILYILYSSL